MAKLDEYQTIVEKAFVTFEVIVEAPLVTWVPVFPIVEDEEIPEIIVEEVEEKIE